MVFNIKKIVFLIFILLVGFFKLSVGDIELESAHGYLTLPPEDGPGYEEASAAFAEASAGEGMPSDGEGKPSAQMMNGGVPYQ
ncbi:unnamed protein product [Larinioides sclopetarius]|uniref:Secreted protein n=1 Tax=Larinioides sclopetarius TaxID=280406 RepID=A0AAV2BB21_9ARAC